MGSIRLGRARVGEVVTITTISGKESVEDHVRSLGLLPGERLRLLRRAPLGGPLMVEVRGRTIALGEAVAACILVKRDPEGAPQSDASAGSR